jgi:hypothetical protein
MAAQPEDRPQNILYVRSGLESNKEEEEDTPETLSLNP